MKRNTALVIPDAIEVVYADGDNSVGCCGVRAAEVCALFVLMNTSVPFLVICQ